MHRYATKISTASIVGLISSTTSIVGKSIPVFPSDIRGVYTYAIGNTEKACSSTKTELSKDGQELDYHSDNLALITARRIAQFEEICELTAIAPTSLTGNFRAALNCEGGGETSRLDNVDIQTFSQGQGSQSTIGGLVIRFQKTERPQVYVRCQR